MIMVSKQYFKHTQMLCNLQNQLGLSSSDFQSVEDWRQSILKLNINDGTNNGYK